VVEKMLLLFDNQSRGGNLIVPVSRGADRSLAEV
jgi:hypothetical protein